MGTIAFRTNLLAAAVGAWTVTAVYLLVYDLQSAMGRSRFAPRLLPLAPAFAALALAAAPDLWQHAIHANAHVLSAALGVTHLWLLVRWWRTKHDRWLALFALTLGLAATHHPIIAIGVPAYGLFILAVRPRLLLRWRTLLLLAGCLLLGLAPLLYYPLRSPSVPFGPTDMDTWTGFVRHITAQGLRVNLFHFGLADQPHRALVFWSLLRLQFLLPVILLIPLGLVVLVRHAPGPALLVGGFVLSHLAFTINTVQDVMAYLLMPFAALAVLAGVGARAFFDWGRRVMLSRAPIVRRDVPSAVCSLSRSKIAPRGSSDPHVCPESPDSGRARLGLLSLLLAGLLLPWPMVRAVQNLSRGISLRDFTAAETWVDAVHERFDGKGGGAILLSAWEYLTPLWVHAYTQGRELDEQDVELVYVSTAIPWPDAVWAHIGAGPTYLPDYRPLVRDAGFRLLPDGSFYRVEVPPVDDATPSRQLDLWVDERVRILGYDLPETMVRAGDPLRLTIYQGAPDPMEGIWMPYAQLGPIEDRWTTDSRLLTTHWHPGEIVVERYELLVPFNLPPGDYPVRLGYADLTGGRSELSLSSGGGTVELDTITVLPNPGAPAANILERSLANLDNQVALMGARVRVGGQWRRAFWDEPIVVRPGSALHLTLNWRALSSPRDSATVFIHLIDAGDRFVAGWDYTPLGGSAPTYLWFPKWLPGQVFVDPYRLRLPDGLPPGEYRLEVGMYGMTSHRRFPVVHLSGDLAGDRVILGSLRVE